MPARYRITIRCTRSRGPRGFLCLQVFRRGTVNAAVELSRCASTYEVIVFLIAQSARWLSFFLCVYRQKTVETTGLNECAEDLNFFSIFTHKGFFMTPLRTKMIRELELQRKSKSTIKAYITAVKELALYFNRSPKQISRQEIRDYAHYLITEKKLANASVNIKLSAIIFLYRRVVPDVDPRTSRQRRQRPVHLALATSAGPVKRRLVPVSAPDVAV